MAKRRPPNQETLDEIARLTKNFHFIFGNPDHYQLQKTIKRLEHKLMYKQKTPKDKEDIIILRGQVGLIVNKIK